MSDLPEPLVPGDCDLRDFPFMPVDIVRLFGSDFHAQSTDAEWRAGFTLWLRAYHQVPAGSLPDDEIALARLAELGRDVKTWRKVRDGALRGWVKCADGRLYHRTVAEKALEGWIEKLLQRKSSAAGNAKRYGHPFEPAVFDNAIETSLSLLAALNPQSRVLAKRFSKPPTGTAAQSPTGSPSRPPNHANWDSQETGKRQGRDTERNARDAQAAFDGEFWPIYPHKVGKPAALKSFEKLYREMRGDVAPIIDGLRRYIDSKPADRPWLNPTTFLNQRRFEDQPASTSSGQDRSSISRIDFGGGVKWPEQTVRDAVARWRTDPSTWPDDRLGPPPGSSGCRVPDRLLQQAA